MYNPSPSRVPTGTRIASSLVATLVLILGFSASVFSQSPEKKPASSRISYVERPLAFEANPGSDASGELFSAKGRGYAVSLHKDGALVSFPASAGKDAATPARSIGLRLVDGNPQVDVAADSRNPGVTNYFPTSDQKTWRMGVPNWGRVNYRQVYPGVDLSFYGRKQLLEYDFRVQPKADPNRIQLDVSGAESARLDTDGNLKLKIDGGEVSFLKPVAYQLSADGEQQPVASKYLLSSSDNKHWQVSFAVGPHDDSRELVIDPVLSYGLQLAYADYTISGIAVDASGNTYVTGQNQQRGFYVSKYNSAGTATFTSVVGSGTVTSYPTAIAVDSTGKMYVVGEAPPGLPTTSNAYLTTSPSLKTYYSVPFIAVLPATGAAPTYLSYLGGTNNTDYASGVALDGSNAIYLTGYEESTNFPTTTGAILSTFPGVSYAAFVAKIDPTKSGTASLVYSTLLGASGLNSYGAAIAVDGTNNAYVASISNQGFPVTSGAFTYAGSYSDSYTNGAYVTKINPTGTAILYSAYLGVGQASGIALDTNNDAYVTGEVYAEDFPTTSGAYQTTYPGGFVSELNPAGSALVYSTFLSGPSGAFSPSNNTVFPQSIVLPAGCASACTAYIAGYTNALDYPAVNAIQAVPLNSTAPSAFVTELAGDGSSALFSSYFGAVTGTITSPFSTPLFPTPALDVDGTGNMYLALNASGSDFPSTLPPTTTQIPYSFLAKIAPAAGGLIVPYPAKQNFDSYNTSGQPIGISSTTTGIPVPVLLRNMGSAPVAISSITFTPATQFSETDSCNMTIPAGGTCTLNLAFLPTTKGVQTATLSIASNAVVSPVSIALSGTGQALGDLQISSPGITFPDTALGSSSTQQMLTVTNIGKSLVNLQPITVSSLRQNWGNGSDFQVLSNCPAQLQAAASCTVGVTFTPLATGPRGASFSLQGDGFGNETIDLYGAGISGTAQGTVALSATILNFNTQLINTGSPRQTVVLTNTSTTPVSIYGVTIATTGQTTGSDFSIYSGNCVNTSTQVQINPQGTCSVTVQFTPTTSAAETGTLTINDSVAGSPQTVALTGMGLASSQSLEFTPGNFVFPDQPLGLPSAASYFYVYNTGTAPITVDRILSTGDFHVYSTSCAGAILKPNPAVGYEPSPNCNVRVQFTPTAVGSRTGSLIFVDSAGAQQMLTLTGMGITATGGVFLEPTSLLFGQQAVGTTSVTQRLTITNPGNSPTTINNITATGDYAIVDSCTGGTFPYVLGSLRSCNVDISFTPTSTASPDSGTAVVDSSGGTATIPLSGSGITATLAIGVTPALPLTMSFGNEATGSQSFTYNAYIRNAGTEAITLTSTMLTGADAADYSFSTGSCGFYGNTLLPGVSCYVQVSFIPAAAGTRTASVALVDSVGTQTIALTGVGVAALTGAQAVPGALSFDQVPVGGSSVNTQSAALHNYGTTALTITSAQITTGGSSFLIPVNGNGCTGTAVPAGSSCNVSISFSPTATGNQTGVLTFTDSHAVKYTVTLAGYSPAVTPSSYLDPGSLAFPGQVLTTFSNGQTVSLNNTGDVPMTVGNLTGTNTIVGASTTGAFSLNGTQGGNDGCSGAVVAARSRCTISVTFAPTVAGTATGTVVLPVTYSNNATAQYTLNLTGTGLAIKDTTELSPSSLTFQDQAVAAVPNNGADQTQVINLYNTGNLPITLGALTGTDVVIGSTTTGDFTTASLFGGNDGCTNQTVYPNSSCQVAVGFNPLTAVAKAGSIKFPVTYSDKTTTTLTATLAGKGIADGSKVVVSPTSGQFDVQVVGTTSDSSETLIFTVNNTGNLPVKISTATVTSNYSFVSDNCSGTTVPVNSYCQISVAFSPTKTGAIPGTLSIPDTALGSPQKIALTGTGIAATSQIVLSQTNIAFGNQTVSTRSAIVYVLASNQSSATVPVNTVVLGGANPTDFILGDGCSGQSISPHSYCQLTVQFAPAAASTGARTATITETDTASGSPRTITLTGTGITSSGAVAIYPGSINFGSQGLGTKSAAQTFSITNTGTGSLTIANLVSSNQTEFPLSNDLCLHQTLAAGANCLVSVAFAPNAGSTQTATITVTDNSGGVSGSTQTMIVSGVSVGIPQAKLAPTSLTFASQGVGVTSAAQTITLSDSGTDTLAISGITITGTNPTAFHETNTCGTSIVAGANCTISVTFDPAVVGASTATLNVTDNAGNTAGTVQTATLSGTGTGVAKIAFSPTSLVFTSTNVGASSAVKTVTVSNPGTAPLAITSIGITPTGDYTQTNTCGTSLAVGSTCVISVTFTPSAAGTRTASISVADNAAGSPHTVALSGTAVGVPTATLSATSLVFPSQAIGVVSAAQPIMLTNTGSGNLVVATVKIAGTNAVDFAETSSTCPGTLAPAAACTINITFKPSAAGSRISTLTITDNNNNVANSTQSVALSGTGAGTPQAHLSATTMTFASDPVGKADGPESIVLSNPGNGPLSISSIVVSGTNASEFLEFDTCVPSVAAGGSCEIALYFVPQAAGTRTASVVITDNANNVANATQTLSVTGTAVGSPTATLSLTTMAFATVKVGTQSSGQSVTLTNSGNSPLTVASVALAGTDPGDYSVFNTCTSVSPGSSCIAVVFFKPTVVGSRPATLTFTDNSGNVAGTKQNVTLTGTGN